jgi:hypothetical protein
MYGQRCSLIQTCLATADRYYPGFAALLYSDITPAQAVARIEDE